MHEIDAERGIRQCTPESIPLWMPLPIRPASPAAGQKAEEQNDDWTIEHHHRLQHRGRIGKRFVKDLDLQQEVAHTAARARTKPPTIHFPWRMTNARACFKYNATSPPRMK